MEDVGSQGQLCLAIEADVDQIFEERARRLARARRSSQRPTVCKYWLRGLCSKADGCEFLHRYDPDRMAECQFYARYGECSAAEDCPFRHTRRGGPKAQECERFKHGFCPLGPRCPHTHVKRLPCQFFLQGFCPLGRACPFGHPRAFACLRDLGGGRLLADVSSVPNAARDWQGPPMVRLAAPDPLRRGR